MIEIWEGNLVCNLIRRNFIRAKIVAPLLAMFLASCTSETEMRAMPPAKSFLSAKPAGPLADCIYNGIAGVDRTRTLQRFLVANVIHITARSQSIDQTPVYDISVAMVRSGSRVELRSANALSGGPPYETDHIIDYCLK